jgi:hypothetical protein
VERPWEPAVSIPDPAFSFDRGIGTITWPDLALEMTFNRIYQDRRNHELTAEVTCFTGSNGSRGLLHRGRLNLGSIRSRRDTAAYLAARLGDVDCEALLELASWKVVEAVRRGRPAILLREVVDEPASGGLVVPPLLLASDPVILFGDGGSSKSFLGLALGDEYRQRHALRRSSSVPVAQDSVPGLRVAAVAA